MSTPIDDMDRRNFFQYLAALGWTGTGGTFISDCSNQSANNTAGTVEEVTLTPRAISYPKDADSKEFGTSGRVNRESAIQSAINHAKNNGGGRVDLSKGLIPFDERAVTVPDSVFLCRPDQPQVLGVGDISDLRNLSTDDAVAAHVRRPIGKSGIFVPFDSDPFGLGDNGATALRTSAGAWWVREEALHISGVKARWFGIPNNGQTGAGLALSALTESYDNITLEKGIFLINTDATGANRLKLGATLHIKEGATIKVESGVTLEVASKVDAGHYQVFEGDGTVTAPQGPPQNDPLNETYIVRPEWFGANGDASLPSPNAPEGTSPTGTENLQAFQDAVFFCNRLAQRFGLNFGNPLVTLQAKPAARYYCKGDNILGHQVGDEGFEYGFTFDGQDCVFYWEPESKTDGFFGRTEFYCRPRFRDFKVLCIGYTGSRGTFWKNIESTTLRTVQPRFTNIEVYGRSTNSNYTPTSGTTLKELFRLEGSRRGDRLYLDNCYFKTFDLGFFCSNSQAVSISIQRTTLNTEVDGATFFHFQEQDHGFTVDKSDLLSRGQDQTLFFSEAVDEPRKNSRSFSFRDSRLEVRETGFVGFHVQFGHVVVDNTQFIAGGGGVPNDDPIMAWIENTGSIKITNSQLKGVVRVGTKTPQNLPVQSTGIRIEDSDPRLFAGIEVDNGSNISNVSEAASNREHFPNVDLRGSYTSNLLSWGGTAEPGMVDATWGAVYDGTEKYRRNVVARAENGFYFLDDTPVYFPPHVLITDALLIVPDTHLAGIEVNIGSWSSGELNVGNGSLKKIQLIPDDKMGLSIATADPSERAVTAQWFDAAGTKVSDRSQARISCEYKGIGVSCDVGTIGTTEMTTN